MGTSKSRRGRGKKRRARACGSKVAYAKDVAIAKAVAMTKKRSVSFNAYKCPFCHLPSGACAWHVGHRATLRHRLS